MLRLREVLEPGGEGLREATVRAQWRTRARFPSPPHCATSPPPGFNAAKSEAKSDAWSRIQWKVAVLKTASTGSGSCNVGQVRLQVAHAAGGQRLEVRPCLFEHLRALVHGPHATSGNAREQLRGDASASAAGVQHPRVLAHRESREHLPTPRRLGPGDLVVRPRRPTPAERPRSFARPSSASAQRSGQGRIALHVNTARRRLRESRASLRAAGQAMTRVPRISRLIRPHVARILPRPMPLTRGAVTYSRFRVAAGDKELPSSKDLARHVVSRTAHARLRAHRSHG